MDPRTTTEPTRMYVHQPGNATRYEVIIAPIPNDPQYIVALPDFGASFRWDGLDAPHWAYLAEKVERFTRGDAEVMSDFLEEVAHDLRVY